MSSLVFFYECYLKGVGGYLCHAVTKMYINMNHTNKIQLAAILRKAIHTIYLMLGKGGGVGVFSCTTPCLTK